MTTTERLADFIRDHGFRAWIAPDGTLYGEMLWTSRDGNGADVEPITPTASAVRDWLGY